MRRYLLGMVVAGWCAAAMAQAPEIQFREKVLDNGMKVYSVQDSSSPTVAIQVWYHVGSKDDPQGRSGFAHLFEHMMFKSTKNMPSETFDRLTEDVGGENNAYTGDDVTVYHETVPSNYLETLLWAEGERMAALVVDQANFQSERDVVKEEFRQNFVAEPYGKLYLLMDQRSYTTHPYKRPGIGNIDELNAAKLQDVVAFHETYYRPDNATLIVVGDFDTEQLDSWVERYLGSIPRPSQPLPRVQVQEPPRTEELRYSESNENVPLPAVAQTYLTTTISSPEAQGLEVLAALLAEGTSSRLYQSLVYGKQVAQSVSAWADLREDTGTLAFYVIVAGDKTPAEAEAALNAELDRIRREPVPAAELEKVKAQLLAKTIKGRETNEGKADALGQAAVLLGEPRKINTEPKRLEQVSAAEIQQLAQKYLIAKNRVSIEYTSADAVAARQSPPPPAAPRKAKLSKPSEKTLPNGLRVIVVERPALPLLSAKLLVPRGPEMDPPELTGLTRLTALLLPEGTQSRTAPQIAEAVDTLGASLEASADWDASEVRISAMSNKSEQILELLADVVRRPAFRAEDVERLRKQTLDELSIDWTEPSFIAGAVTSRLLFGAGAYGTSLRGTPETLARIRPEDLAALHARLFRPDQAILVLSGQIPAEQAFGLAQKFWGDWKAPTDPLPQAREVTPSPKQRRILVIDKPDAGQASVVVACRAPQRTDPDYYPLQLSNMVLGGGYSARLNQEVRIKRGLSYGAWSSLQARRTGGWLVERSQTKNESATDVAGLLLDELERIAKETVPSDELTPRRASLMGNFARDLETNEGWSDRVGRLALYGIGLDQIEGFLSGIEAVTPEQVQASATAKLDIEHAQIVIVGTASAFLDELKKRFPDVEVIPVSELDLGSPSLHKP